MQKNLSWYTLVVVLVGCVLVGMNADSMRSTSVDIAHHYSLIFRLSENWSLTSHDPTLGEMNVYPRSSHLAAAFMGKLVGSPFMGMHLVALLALLLLWASILAILYAAPNRTGPLNALVMALAVALNFGAFRIHGAEISQNYFFAQLVAQALAMAVMALAIRIEARHGHVASYAVLLCALWPLTGVHLLPALALLTVLAGLLLLDVGFSDVSPLQRVQRALVACVVLGIGLGCVVLHPAFTAMRSIASNNGDISLGPLAPLWSVGAVCLIALACSLSLLRAWRRDPVPYVMYKYLGVYGAAVSVLCLVQTMLRWFDIGSDYAAKKYAFAVVTFLFMRLALWLGARLASRAATMPRVVNASNSPAFAIQVFALTLFVTATGAAKMRHGLDIQAVAGFEQQLTHLPSTTFPLPAAGRQNVILDLHGMPNVVNYMFSLAIARTPRDAALLVLRDGNAADARLLPAQLGTILTSSGNTRFPGMARCATALGRDLVAVDAMCVARPAVAVVATAILTPS